MTIEIPPDIPQWAVVAAAGEKFPLLDEDRMRALQALLLQAMQASERSSSNFDNLLAQLRLSGESEAVTAAVQSGREILLAWGGLTAGLGKVASHVGKTAGDGEFTKVVIITALSQLVAQVGLTVLFPPGAVAADLRAFAAARVAVREAIEWLIAKLGGRGLHLVVLGGAAQGALPNLVAQLYQIDNGERQGIDRKSLGTSIVAGGVGGVAGQKAAERLMPVLNRIDQRYVAQLPQKWLQKSARGAEVLTLIGAAGAAGGVAGLVAATVGSSQEFSLSYLVNAAAGGMSGSMIGGAVHAFRSGHSISGTDKLGELAKVEAADPYRADLLAASSMSKRVWEDAVVAQRAATPQRQAAMVPAATAESVVIAPGEVSDEAADGQTPTAVVPAVAKAAPATRPGTDVVPMDSAGPSQSRTTGTSSGVGAPAGVPGVAAPHPDGGIPRIGDTEAGVLVEPRRPELIAMDATAAAASQPIEVAPRTSGSVGTARPDDSQTAHGARLAPAGAAEAIGDRVGQEGGVRPGRPAADIGVSKVIAPEVVRPVADSITDRRTSVAPSEVNSAAPHPATAGAATVSGATTRDQVPAAPARSSTAPYSPDARAASADAAPGSMELPNDDRSQLEDAVIGGALADGDRQFSSGDDGVVDRRLDVEELNGKRLTTTQQQLRAAAQEILDEYHARSSELVPESMRLNDVPDEVLKFGLLHGDEHDSFLAAIETIRRHSGKLLYREQLMGVLAMRDGLIPEMAPGSGKTLTAAVHNVWTAVHRGPTLLVTSSDPLAYEAFVEYNAIFGESGVKFVRIDPDRPVPPPQPGEPTVYIATQDALGFAELRGHLDNFAFELATIDEIDAALFYMNPTYVISDGAVRPASPETAQAIVEARDFVDDALAATTLTDIDFGRDPALPRSPARLTDEALANVRRLWEGELTDDDVKRINAAAAVALGDFVEGDHFVMHEGRPVIIDQVSHKVMRDPRTATESRWHDIAPAIEAAMAKKYDAAGREHTVVIHGNSETSKSTTLGEVLRRHVDSLTGTSGTVMNTAESISTVYGTGDAVAIPRTKQYRLEHGGTIVAESQHEKRTALIDNIVEVSGKEGLPQLVLTHRNSDVAGIAADLRTRLPDESIAVVDAKWILDQGADWEDRLHEIVEKAGEPGKITLINMQGGRGNDYKVPDEISRDGGMVAHLYGNSSISQDVDMQARNRVARNGQRGRVYEYLAVDDALFDRTGHPPAQLVITQYRDAATAYRNDPSEQHQAALDHAANDVLDMVPVLQQLSLHRLKSLFLPTNIAALVDGPSSSGAIEPTAFVSEQTKPQAMTAPESAPADHHDRDQVRNQVADPSDSLEPLPSPMRVPTNVASDPASTEHADPAPDTNAAELDSTGRLRQPPPTAELLQQAQHQIATRDLMVLLPGEVWPTMPHHLDSAGGPGRIDPAIVQPTDPGFAAPTTDAAETAPRLASISPRPAATVSPVAVEQLPQYTTTTDYLEAESGARVVASAADAVNTAMGTTPWSHAPEHHQRRRSPRSLRPPRGKNASTTPWQARRPPGDPAAAAGTPWSSARSQVIPVGGSPSAGFDVSGLLRRQGVEVALWQAERAGDVVTVAELRALAVGFDEAGSSELVRLLDAAVVEGVSAPARRLSGLGGVACAVVVALRLRDFQSALGNEWDRGIPRVVLGEEEVDPIAWSTVLGGHGEDRLGGGVGHRWVQDFLFGVREGESGSVTVEQARRFHGRAVVVMDKVGAGSAHTYLVVNWKGTLLVVDPAGYERPFRFDPSRAGSVQAVRLVRLEADGRPSDPIVTQIVDVRVDGARPRTVVEDYWKSLPTERPPDAISHKDWMPAVSGVESRGPIPDPADRNDPEQSGETRPMVYQAMHVVAPTRRDEIDPDPSPELDRLGRLVESDQELISHHASWDPEEKAFTYLLFDGRVGTIELRMDPDSAAAAVRRETDIPGGRHILHVATWALRADASDVQVGRGIARHVEGIRANDQQHAVPTRWNHEDPTTISVDMIGKFAELRYVVGRIDRGDADHLPELTRVLEELVTGLGLPPNEPHAATRMTLLNAWDPRSRLADRLREVMPSLTPDRDGRFWSHLAESKIARLERLWYQSRVYRNFPPERLGMAPLEQLHSEARGSDPSHTHAELLRQVDADSDLITRGYGFWDPTTARFTFIDGDNQRVELVVWTSPDPIPGSAGKVHQSDYVDDVYHVFVSPTVPAAHGSLVVADAFGQIRHLRRHAVGPSAPIGSRGARMTVAIAGRFAQLGVLVGKLDRAMAGSGTESVSDLRMDLAQVVSDLDRQFSGPDSFTWPTLLARSDALLAERVAYWQSRFGSEHTEVTPSILDDIDYPYNVEVRNVGDFHGRARPDNLPDLTDDELRHHIESDLALILDGSQMRWVQDHFEFTTREGSIQYLYVTAHKVRSYMVAAWGHDFGRSYRVSVSPRTHPEDVSRAVKGALDQFTDDYNEPRIPWIYEYGQLRFVVKKLDAASTLGQDAVVEVLGRKLAALAADLRIRPADPGSDHRMRVLAERDEDLARRLTEWIPRTQRNRVPVDAVYRTRPQAVLSLQGAAVRANAAVLTQSRETVIGEIWDLAPVESARAMREGGVRELHASLQVALQLRRAGETLPIMVTGLAVDEYLATAAIENDLTISVSSIDQLQVVVAIAQLRGKTAKVAVEVDTGKHTGGVPVSEYLTMLIEISGHVADGTIDLCSIFTELAHDDDPFNPMIDIQVDRFYQVQQTTHRYDELDRPGIFHIAGAALAVRPELGLASAARFGAPLYGHLPVEFPGLVLQHATTWWSHVIYIQDVPAGEGVGYDGVPVDHARRIAWIGGGYADRMPYEWGRSAKDLHVSVNGFRLRVAGPVSMDAFPVEIPPGAEVDFGDVAVLAGPGADGELTLDQWSDVLGVPVEQLLNTPPGRTMVASHDGIALVAPEIFDRSTFDPRLASAWASADTDALANNLAVTRHRISDKIRRTDLPLVEPRVMLVLKADAYGNGAEVIALAGAQAGVDFIGAALIDETLKLRASGVTTRLLAWQTHPYSDFAAAIRADVSVAVSSLPVLRAVAAAAAAVGRPAKVHLAVNTGLNREGVSPDRLAEFIPQLWDSIDHGWIEFEGVMSHVDHVEERWETQYRRFSAAVELLVASGLTPELQHLWASAALDVPADRLFTMVRTGIALYGMPSDLGPDPDLRQVLRVHSRVAHVMAISEGAGVGSRQAWIAPRDTTIARITIGYGDLQLPRPGTYQVWIEGERYEVVGQGRDFILADLGPNSDIRENTEVVLLGPGDRGEPTLRDWAIEAGFSEAPMLGRRVAVTAVHAEPGLSDQPSSTPADEGHRGETATTRSRASADATGRSATGAVATGEVLVGRDALGQVEGDEMASGDGAVAYQRPRDGRGHADNQCGPMVVDDVAELFGRGDIRRLGTAGLSGVLISELEGALGGHAQHLTGTVDAVARLAALGRALDVEQPGRGNGVAVVVFEPAVSGRRGDLGHAWWLIRRVGPNATERFELRDPGKGRVLSDFVPPQSASNGRGVLALYLDNKGHPVAGGAPDSNGVVRWRGSFDDFAVGRDLDPAVGARSAIAGFGPHHGLVDGQFKQVEELDKPERAGRLTGDTRSAAGVSKKGANHERNDDAMMVVEFTRHGKPVVVAAVFDGVGGAPDGHRAAREAAVELGAYLKANWPHTLFKRTLTREAVLRDALHHVHQKVQALGRQPEYADSEDKPQCTVAVAITEPDRYTVGWVGDSRVGWASADGRHAMWWTADHSYIRRFAKELGITEPQAIQQFPWLENSRHIIEYALGRAIPAGPNDHKASEEYVTTVLVSDGIDAPVRAENGQLEAPRGGVVIAGTDGAVKTMSTAEEFGSVVRRHAGDLGAMANDVVDRAVESGENDDITVVVVQHSPQERRAWWRRKPRSEREDGRASAAPQASKDGTAERVPVAASPSAHELNQCGPEVLKLHRQDTGNPGVVTTRVVGLGGMWVKDLAADSGGRLQYFSVDRNRAHLHVEAGLRALVAGLPEGQRDGVSVLVVDGHREFGEYGVSGHVYRLVYRADENGENGWIEVQDPGKGLSGLFEDTVNPDDLEGIWAMAFDRNGHALELPGGATDGPTPEFFVGRSRDHDEQHAPTEPVPSAAVENESTVGRPVQTSGSQASEAGTARSAAGGLLVGGRRTDDPTDPHRPLRVVTWNIAGGRRVLSQDSNKPFDYGGVDLPYFVEQLRRIDADVICLQETEIDPDGSTAQQLAAMLGYRYVYETEMSPSHMDTSKRLGIAVLSRLPIQDAESQRLPSPQFELRVRAEQVQPYARFAQVVTVAGIPVGNVSPMPLHVFKDEAGRRYTYESGEGATLAKEIGRTVTAMMRGRGIWVGDTNTDNPVLVYGPVFDKLGMIAALDPTARTVPPHPRRPVGAPDQLWATAETFGVAASGTVATETDHYPAWVDWDVADPELAGLLRATRQVEREVAAGEDSKPERPGDTSGVDRPSAADGGTTGRAFQVGGATFYATGEQVLSDPPSDGANTGTTATESGKRLGSQNDVVSRNPAKVDWDTLLGGPGQPRVVLLGEEHSNSRTRFYVADLAAELKAAGVTHFGIEALDHPQFDALNNGESVDLEGVSCGPGRYGLGAIGRSYRQMVLAIAAQGIKIVPIDLSISNPRSIDWRTLLEREEHMTNAVAGALGERPDAKVVVLVGKSHVGPEIWGNKSLSRRLREEQYPVTSVLLEGGYDSKEPTFEDGVLNLPPGMDHLRLEAIAETHVGLLGHGLPSPMVQVASGVVSTLVCLMDGEMQLKLRNLADRGVDVLDVGLTGQAGGASYMVLNGPPGDPILEQILHVRMRAEDLVARDMGQLISEMLYDCDHVSTLSGTVAALLTRLPVHPQDDFTWSASVGRDHTGRRMLQCSVYDQRGKPLADVKIPLLTVPNDTRSHDAGAELAPPDGEGSLPIGGAASSIAQQRAAADPMTAQRIPHLVESSDSSGYRGTDIIVYLPAELARSLLGTVGEPGRRAREILDEYGISVSYGSYPVSRYDTVRNHIDLELWEDGHAGRLVEMTVHAKWALEGWSARNDPVAFARDVFVHRAHEEDAAAAVERIFATMELQQLDPGVPDAPAQREYREGYRLALAEAESAGLTVEEQLDAADRGGRSAVFRHLVETDFKNPGADWDIAMAESQDTSEWVDLYSGTDRKWAAVIRSDGVDTNFPRYRCDFGQGFYLTRDRAQAEEWASLHPHPEVLHYRIRCQDLDALSRKSFSEESHDLADFVRHYRTGGGGTPHDVIEGPMLLNPRQFLAGDPPEWGGSQVVFFRATGAMLDAALQP
ncbi:alanine racemase [Nocardia sp. NPDC049190]|uniref:alanine racemase n=1 Tax=Nocardia sp. NPDC049190 TaxID=3155650 RepID=UPI0033F0495B